MRRTAAVWAGKATGALSRISRLGGGTTLPGDVARAIDPDVLRKLSRDLKQGAIVITGTNGKTTTARLISWLLEGAEAADSLVVNPHKWMFVPIDLSVLYTPHEALLRRAFSLIPAYLETPESDVRNYMDYGVQLGRRFRGLKLWFVLRAYGRRRIVEIIRNHVAWTQELARWIGEAGDFEVLAPHPLSVVCFRHVPARLAHSAAALDEHNQCVVDEINRGGFAFLSTTRLNDRLAIRFAIGNARTTHADVRETWDLVLRTARRLATGSLI